MSTRVYRLFGIPVWAVTSDEKPDNDASDLSGGSLGSERIDAGPTDRLMGFTNDREVS